MNAAQEDDGINYFCVGFTMSATCPRDRQIIVYLSLAANAKAKLTALHGDPVKVRKIMNETQQQPLRRYSVGSLIPGTIIPRVVGTILDADKEIQRQFFFIVNELFSDGGQLPVEYQHQNKDEVFFHYLYSFKNLHVSFIGCKHKKSCAGVQIEIDAQH
jgi:hypothetical protein